MGEDLESYLAKLMGVEEPKKEEKKEVEEPPEEEKKPEKEKKSSTDILSVLQPEQEVKEEKKPEAPLPVPVEQPKKEVTPETDVLSMISESKSKEKQKHVVTVADEEFDFSEEVELGKEVHLIYGLKGHGKTTLALSYPGKIAVLSFDRKSTAVKYLFGDRLDDIRVWNAVKYMDYSSPEAELVSADRNFRYLLRLLDEVVRQWEPDWVVIDGSEILSHICELVMRYRNGLMPFQGVANLNLWKERRMYLRQIHYLALDVAKKGVIYTTYVDKEEIIEDGEVKTKRDIPKWLDILVYETDVVIRVWSTIDKGSGLRFYAIVESSKVPYIRTGVQADITNRLGFDEIVRLSKVQGPSVIRR